MDSSVAAPTTLLELIGSAPAGQTAVILPDLGVRVTYGALRSQVEAVAEALAASGVGRHDRVGIALPNGLPTLVAVLAASTAGAAVPLNPACKEDEFRFHLEDAGVRLLLVPPDGATDARRAAETRTPALTVDMDSTGHVSLSGVSLGRSPHPPAVDDAALVLHTSGGTGQPKRVPLTHAQLSLSARAIARSYALTPDDVSLCVMPLFHVHGLVASALATLASGGTLVLPSRFSPLSFWRVAKKWGVTWYSAVPTLHQLLLARAGGRSRPPGTDRLRFIRSCSAPLSPHVMHELEAAFGAPTLEAYGMTEAAHQMTTNPLPPGARKPGSVGPGTSVRLCVVDGGGQHVPQGERGEVVIQGPTVIQGYEDGPEANASLFVGGWFRTGDLGYLDADGYLTLVGRLNELINRGGEKISPREVDNVLVAHPAVAEAVSFGVPHRIWGEEVAAAVVLRTAATESELLAYCRERLSDNKRPKQIHFTQVIPRTATGKIQRGVVARGYR